MNALEYLIKFGIWCGMLYLSYHSTQLMTVGEPDYGVTALCITVYGAFLISAVAITSMVGKWFEVIDCDFIDMD